MSNYRTSSLFHYTTYNGLKSILKQGIIPNYCKEDFSIDGDRFAIGIPMVSFCDIPLTRTKEFTKRYGHHAIGIRKEWAVKNGINPILYINDENIITSLKFYKEYELYSKAEMKTGKISSINLKINPVKVQYSSDNYKSSHNANLNLFGFSKKYMGINPHTGKSQCNYEENEWRFILKEEEGILWKWGETAYSSWRGKPKEKKPGPDEFLKANTLKFGIDDISYIIVQFENQRIGVINYISRLTRLCESDSSLDENSKKILFSKIISMERIDKDF